MSEVLHDARQEFWRPPLAQPSATPVLPDACRRCGTEFMVGAAFCHICGLGRHSSSGSQATHISRYLGPLRALEFSRVRTWFGLPTAPLCALLIGIAFMVVALSMGLMGVRDYTDFEAIQLWRIQWLMAACAAFLAGILLKNRKSGSE